MPLTDLPYYAARYLTNRVHRLFSGERRLAMWGPRFEGMDSALAKYSLGEVCALQWQRCVERSAEAFAAMPSQRWREVAYESFVCDPQTEFAKLLSFLELEVPAEQQQHAVANVRANSIGKGRAALADDAVQRLGK